ncbi:glucan biosynthesis protein [Halomonas ramblicola]|uniref:glucan biosynthesis protein n=1 Tax=Halomonas ramblicola TaxID=747349 RepID=UPI0025B57440|nr:glucan biosynthesis protein G [Halomonas ramblicola]MDN3520134.1 glucan biosynthesis protein G [Halomonas ramblicola]
MTTALRRLSLAWGLALSMDASAAAPEELFDRVADRARQLAAESYQAPESLLPPELAEMDYDQYREIRFEPEASIWKDEGLFEVQLFHPGFLYDQPVRLNLVDGQGAVRPLPFRRERFRYDGDASALADLELDDIGHAGFRLHYPLNRGDYHDEFAVFLGATYFRLVGRHQGYGLSTRGLAIDTAEPHGEEFPAFRAFWLLKPEPEATRMTVVALLDSPSLAGAYRFDIAPGEHTTVDTEARLFAREDIDKLGIAPLTSMYLHGEIGHRPADDYRPRVHDSNGLVMQTGSGEWILRPLSNPEELRLSRFQDQSPKGFGLLQRPRDFSAFLDAEAHYERRPSQWVQPLEDWGRGSVELVEIPTRSETHDNITAYWVPDRPLAAGESRRYRYRTLTFGATPPGEEVARVIRTRQGWGAVPGQDDPPPASRRQFVVDFRGGELAGLDASQPVEMTLESSSGETLESRVRRLPDGETWRASFRLAPEGDTPADMRLFLTLNGRRLTETWNYVWYPDEFD